MAKKTGAGDEVSVELKMVYIYISKFCENPCIFKMHSPPPFPPPHLFAMQLFKETV